MLGGVREGRGGDLLPDPGTTIISPLPLNGPVDHPQVADVYNT